MLLLLLGNLRAGLIAPGEVPRRFAGTGTEIGGMLDVLTPRSESVVFLPSLWLLPGGPLAPGVLERYADAVDRALAALPERPAGILAAVHGCTAAARRPDATGWLLSKLRSGIGDAPIVATADFHAIQRPWVSRSSPRTTTPSRSASPRNSPFPFMSGWNRRPRPK